MLAIFRVTCHLVRFIDFKQLGYTVIALTISGQERNRTDNERTTERERETYTNQPSTVSATPGQCNEGVPQEVKPAISVIEHVVFDFGCIVETSVPIEFYQSTLSKRTFQ